MTFRQSTSAYEKWLATKLEIVPADLRKKHTLMREAAFPFLRATFYRWCQIWPEICPELNSAKAVAAIGDLHVENFGTWRDIEGRLIWGVNDFDESDMMPWTLDLVRLAASVHLAIEADRLKIDRRDACTSILNGYREGLEAGGHPWVLGEENAWLSDLVELKNPHKFWEKLLALHTYKKLPPKPARRGLEKLMPAPKPEYRIAARPAGLGSRGRLRLVAIAKYAGGHICREAKALAPSGWWWAMGASGAERLRGRRTMSQSVRAADPFVRIKDGWTVRRLAPDCIRIELADVSKDKEKGRLLHAMGWETANVHVGSDSAAEILAEMKALDPHWLHEASEKMVAATKADWKEWGGREKPRKPVRRKKR